MEERRQYIYPIGTVISFYLSQSNLCYIHEKRIVCSSPIRERDIIIEKIFTTNKEIQWKKG